MEKYLEGTYRVKGTKSGGFILIEKLLNLGLLVRFLLRVYCISLPL